MNINDLNVLHKHLHNFTSSLKEDLEMGEEELNIEARKLFNIKYTSLCRAILQFVEYLEEVDNQLTAKVGLPKSEEKSKIVIAVR